MQNLKFTLILGVALWAASSPASAQIASPLADWSRVQNVATASNLHVNTSTSHVYCQLKAVDAESLTCLHDFKEIVFKRPEIKSIKIGHRTRSTWVGVAIGYFGTLLVGTPIANHSNDAFGNGLAVAAFAILAAIGGALIGHFTDFTAHLLYKVD